MQSEFTWQKSSYSSQASNCIEIAHGDERTTVHLRESDEPTTALTTTPSRFAALLSAARNGQFGDV